MKKEDKVYCLKEGYSPYIYKSEKSFIYCFPVSSGHIDLNFEFIISKADFECLKENQYRYKVLYFLLFFEAQSTFGTGTENPREFRKDEFETCKNIALTKSENDLALYIKEFSDKMNLSENYIKSFIKSVF
ncbi:hypothetical protein [Chryseobacterium sp. MFBS3-17]|uniref:hypothetical protein n=1 Tax=Chryseobacterium sp. MFBS3-17 TaxID=2886689 RepID=UPI001D0EFDC0|nr:hypothetical protein [Chryseobacterium sp. MFBS3-17]MCC2589655.1 hypothetical protein [Chryseobacterium sp. MFBS3-17]